MLELKVPPPFVFLITAALMLIARLATSGRTFATVYGKPVAAVVLALAVGIGWAGISAFGRAGTTFSPREPDRASALVRDGIFRYTRNPMYLGMLLALIAWALWLGHWLSLVCVLLYVWYINRFQIVVEERVLEEKFGPAYLKYKAKVRRWL